MVACGRRGQAGMRSATNMVRGEASVGMSSRHSAQLKRALPYAALLAACTRAFRHNTALTLCAISVVLPVVVALAHRRQQGWRRELLCRSAEGIEALLPGARRACRLCRTTSCGSAREICSSPRHCGVEIAHRHASSPTSMPAYALKCAVINSLHSRTRDCALNIISVCAGTQTSRDITRTRAASSTIHRTYRGLSSGRLLAFAHWHLK